MEEETVTTVKRKTKYSPVKLSIIIVIGFIVMVVVFSLYNKSQNRYLWLSCTYNSDRDEYSERLKFKFLQKQDGKLYEYYRNETYTYSDEESYNKVYDYLIDYKDNLGSTIGGDNIQYEVKKESDSEISVRTYINVGTYGSIFNTYMQELDIDKDSSIEDIYNTLVSSETYTCKVTESK